MKKRHVLVAVLLACVLSLTLCGCSLFGRPNAQTVFPYDVLSEESLSEGSWLASQKAPSTHERRLYEEAVAEGEFGGSYLEFLKVLAEMGYQVSDPSAGVQTALRSAVSVETRYATNPVSGSVVSGLGAGVIYKLEEREGVPCAYIITNHHVVYNADYGGFGKTIQCYLYGAETSSRALLATYVGGSVEYDIAVLFIDGSTVLSVSGVTHTNGEVLRESGCCAVTAFDSDSVLAGESVFALGNPEGQGLSVTMGAVSVTAEYIRMKAGDGNMVERLEMRTDTTINHGNSGGGFFNAEGELIGIVNARSEKEGVGGFGYAIPANRALALAQNIIETAEEGAKGPLVAKLQSVKFSVADTKSVYDEQTGQCLITESVAVTVSDVFGIAGIAGLKTGDTVVSATVKGTGGTVTKAITRRNILEDMLFLIRLGDTLELQVVHAGQEAAETVTLRFTQKSDFSRLL